MANEKEDKENQKEDNKKVKEVDEVEEEEEEEGGGERGERKTGRNRGKRPEQGETRRNELKRGEIWSMSKQCRKTEEAGCASAKTSISMPAATLKVHDTGPDAFSVAARALAADTNRGQAVSGASG